MLRVGSYVPSGERNRLHSGGRIAPYSPELESPYWNGSLGGGTSSEETMGFRVGKNSEILIQCCELIQGMNRLRQWMMVQVDCIQQCVVTFRKGLSYVFAERVS